MAQTPRNALAAAELGRRLADLHEAHPDQPGWTAVQRWLLRRFDVEVSATSIRKAHLGEVDPTACDVDLLVGLAAFYAVPAEALGNFAGRRVAAVLAMAGAASGPGPDSPGEQAIPASTCTTSTPRLRSLPEPARELERVAA